MLFGTWFSRSFELRSALFAAIVVVVNAGFFFLDVHSKFFANPLVYAVLYCYSFWKLYDAFFRDMSGFFLADIDLKGNVFGRPFLILNSLLAWSVMMML